MKTKPCHFYSYLRSQKKVKDHTDYLTKLRQIVTLNLQKCWLKFSTVYMLRKMWVVYLTLIQGVVMRYIPFYLLHKLFHLNTSKAMGPDRIHAWVLGVFRPNLQLTLSWRPKEQVIATSSSHSTRIKVST